jgi:hypothetical protein
MLMILFCSDCKQQVKKTKSQLSCEFNMEDLSKLHYYLGIEVKTNCQNIAFYFSEKKYANDRLDFFRMDKFKHAYTPSKVQV